MVIVDTSIWIHHLRQGSKRLEKLLVDAKVACHPFVVGELACGNIKNRKEFLSLLRSLPMVPTITLDELLYFIDQNNLMGMGIGFVDAHLLSSVKLSNTTLWTSDKRLNAVAKKLGISHN